MFDSIKNYSTNGLVIIVYGVAGVGKTTSLFNVPDKLILSFENGLAPLRYLAEYYGCDFPYKEITSSEELKNVIKFILRGNGPIKNMATGETYANVIIDSEAALVRMIEHELRKQEIKDERKFFYELQKSYFSIVGELRGILNRGSNIISLCPQNEVFNDEKSQMLGPEVFTKKIGLILQHRADVILRMYSENGQKLFLSNDRNGKYICKDRTNKLQPIEPADLAAVLHKIRG